MQDHRRLRVYGAAQRLASEVYVVARSLPFDERFELSSQLRRAAVSVGSNIAEGCGRSSARDFCNFLDYALASTRELDFQLSHCANSALGAQAAVLQSCVQ